MEDTPDRTTTSNISECNLNIFPFTFLSQVLVWFLVANPGSQKISCDLDLNLKSKKLDKPLNELIDSEIKDIISND